MNASELYTQAVVIDGLNVSNWESPTVYSSLRQGGFTAINATVATWENFQQTMDHIAVWLRRFDQRDDILQINEVADIHAAKAEGKTGIILGFQNASPIENHLERLRLFLDRPHLAHRLLHLLLDARDLLRLELRVPILERLHLATELAIYANASFAALRKSARCRLCSTAQQPKLQGASAIGAGPPANACLSQDDKEIYFSLMLVFHMCLV